MPVKTEKVKSRRGRTRKSTAPHMPEENAHHSFKTGLGVLSRRFAPYLK
jgi:hypothetical protein